MRDTLAWETVPAPPFTPTARQFGVKAWTLDPNLAPNVYQTTTGFLHGLPVWLQAGDLITGIAPFFQTAGAGATKFQLGLADATLNLVASTPDTPAAAAVLGWSPVALSAPYLVPKSGIYYVEDVIVAPTMPFWVSSPSVSAGSAQMQMPAVIGARYYSWQDTTGFAAIPQVPPNPTTGAHMHLLLVY